MAQVVTVNGPNPYDLVQGFVDRFNQSRRAQAEMELRRQEMEQQAKYQSGLLDVQNKQVGVAQGGLDLQKSEFDAKQKAARADQFIKSQVAPLLEAGDTAGAAKAAQNAIAADPDLAESLKAWAIERTQTPQEMTRQNTGRYTATETGKAASGSPDVQARALTQELSTGRPMSAYQFADQSQRQPEAADTSTPYGKTLNIEGGRTTSAAQDQQAKTQRDVANIHEAGATKRQGMQINAANAGMAPSGGAASSGLTGDEYLKTLDPSMAGLVKKVANYELDPTKAASLRNPKNAGSEREKLLRAVVQYDPTYDMTQYASRQKLRSDFTSGGASQNIRSLNTAIAHLAKLDASGKALDNSKYPAWNAVGNFASKQGGSSAVTNFQNAADAVASELAKVYKGTGATSDSEIKEWRNNLSPDMSPEQIRGAIETAIDLMAGRAAALGSQWQAGMGKPKDFKIVSDSSARILKERLGIDPSKIEGLGGDEKEKDLPLNPNMDTDPLGLFK